MNTEQKRALVSRFFTGTGASYDRMVRCLTFGIDGRWKARILQHLTARVPSAGRVLDLACGTGILTFLIASRYPGARVIGVDVTEEYLAIAREKARVLGFSNIAFLHSRAEDVRLNETFDCITSSYLAKYADLAPLIAQAAKMLRPGGLLLFHDFTYPVNPILAVVWEAYFKTLQGVGPRFAPRWREIFYGLPEVIRMTRWVPDLMQEMTRQGLTGVRVEYLTFGASAIVTGARPVTA